MQGDTRASSDASVTFTTILGSCIATCLYDPQAAVGGMNHFLLATPGGGSAGADPRTLHRYGVHAMEVLINAMLARGARRGMLRARIYGGASMHGGMRDIGAGNSAFARQFLHDEGIELVAEDVGGTRARRVDFRPAHGLARARIVSDRPPIEAVRPLPVAMGGGDVDLF